MRDGDHYVVNGQKTWTTLAQYANWIFCLVRTRTGGQGASGHLVSPDRHDVARRHRAPIITLDGAHEVNEVWFDEVRVPAENLVGEENRGWTYAKFLLGHERTNIAGIGASKRELQRLKKIAAAETRNGRPLIEDTHFAARVAQVEIDLMALEVTNLRVLSAERSGAIRRRVLDPQGQRLRDPADDLRAHVARGRSERDGRRPGGGGVARAPRTCARGRARGRILQPPQDHDLRGRQRDPAKHHCPHDTRALGAHRDLGPAPIESIVRT